MRKKNFKKIKFTETPMRNSRTLIDTTADFS